MENRCEKPACSIKPRPLVAHDAGRDALNAGATNGRGFMYVRSRLWGQPGMRSQGGRHSDTLGNTARAILAARGVEHSIRPLAIASSRR